MAALLKNPLAYLTLSFVLFLTAAPLISIGATGGRPVLLWTGFAALCIGALIPPVQRLVGGRQASPDSEPGNRSEAGAERSEP